MKCKFRLGQSKRVVVLCLLLRLKSVQHHMVLHLHIACTAGIDLQGALQLFQPRLPRRKSSCYFVRKTVHCPPDFWHLGYILQLLHLHDRQSGRSFEQYLKSVVFLFFLLLQWRFRLCILLPLQWFLFLLFQWHILPGTACRLARIP